MIKAIAAITPITETIVMGPHSGAVIHHHDHAMNPVSFNAINTIVRSPKNPIPPLLDDDLLLMLVIGYIFERIVSLPLLVCQSQPSVKAYLNDT
jgi:hypothetical protein